MKKTSIIIIVTAMMLLLGMVTVVGTGVLSLPEIFKQPSLIDNFTGKVSSIQDSDYQIVVATVNGQPITLGEINFQKAISEANIDALERAGISAMQLDSLTIEYPTDTTAVIEKLARDKTLITAAQDVGISYSDDELMQIIEEEDAYMEAQIAAGNEKMIAKAEEDAEFLSKLGITREEYNEKIYLPMLRRSMVNKEYSKYFYEHNTISYEAYQAHLDELFEAANLIIADEELIK